MIPQKNIFIMNKSVILKEFSTIEKFDNKNIATIKQRPPKRIKNFSKDEIVLKNSITSYFCV